MIASVKAAELCTCLIVFPLRNRAMSAQSVWVSAGHQDQQQRDGNHGVADQQEDFALHSRATPLNRRRILSGAPPQENRSSGLASNCSLETSKGRSFALAILCRMAHLQTEPPPRKSVCSTRRGALHAEPYDFVAVTVRPGVVRDPGADLGLDGTSRCAAVAVQAGLRTAE